MVKNEESGEVYGAIVYKHSIGSAPYPQRHIESRSKIMAVVNRQDYNSPRELDLGGPDGNAYVLLGIAKSLLSQWGREPDMFIDIMIADDYGHLVRTFNEYLGDYFTIILPEGINSLDEL
jgi:hypothetical protein